MAECASRSAERGPPRRTAKRTLETGVNLDTFRELHRQLRKHEVEYVLVGGMALVVHGLVRATEDIDLFVKPTPENVDRLRAAFRDVWNDPSIDEILIEDLMGDYPTVRYGPPGDTLVIDVLSRLGTAFAYDDLEWRPVMFDGVEIRVATPATLYRMKHDTVRPLDAEDARRLLHRFGQEIGNAG